MTELSSRFSALVQELKRRRVFRVTAVYGGAAFVVVQIVDGAFDYLHIPEWFGTATIVLVLLGFPLAVGLAWVFDITPEGISRTDRPKTPSGPKKDRSSGRKPLTSNRALIVVALLAVAFGAWSRWGNTRLTAKLRSDAIAVMYFENLTGDAEFDWMEAGMVEMLTTNLGHIEDMEVISSQRLSDVLRQVTGGQIRMVDRATATQVAQQAGAGSMLLGSVMGSGDQFRLNAQLVNVETGQLLGTEVIDTGPDGTIFALVDTLSMRLVARLGGGGSSSVDNVSITATLTSSLAALRLYVDGVEALNRLQYQRAAELLETAVGIDSTFAMAYYQLSIAHSWIGKENLSDHAMERAGRHTHRLTHRERRLIEAELQPTLKTRKEAFETLVTDYPDEKMAWYRYGEFLFHSYWPQISGEAFRRAVELDPDFTVAYNHLIDWYTDRGEYQKAQEYIDHIRSLDSTAMEPYLEQADLEWHAGRLDQAHAALERLLAVAGLDTLHPDVYLAKIILASDNGDYQRAVEIAAAYRQHIFFEPATSDLAGYSMARGQMAAAYKTASENNTIRRFQLQFMGALFTGDLITAGELLDEELTRLERIGPVNEQLAQVQFYRFLVHHAENDGAGMQRTLRTLKQLLRNTESNLRVTVPIAEAYLQCWEGNHAAAVEGFKSAISLGGKSFNYMELLMLEGLTACLVENHQLTEALDYLHPERLRAASSPYPYRLLQVRLPLRRARVLAKLERQYEALEAYRELLDQLRDADHDFPYLLAARNEYQRLRTQLVN
jgi:TolB-like protein/tetratricopeptide (TPR) repeat protein